ncbi:hypothetical protein [Propioniferax innocua]|uniref:hypothetical protein n=1 Tax=Propioniferax innocua TaxID=1753 RepID=UPI0011515003|nr:hypothetical protein [Propioniferax innocua]
MTVCTASRSDRADHRLTGAEPAPPVSGNRLFLLIVLWRRSLSGIATAGRMLMLTHASMMPQALASSLTRRTTHR